MSEEAGALDQQREQEEREQAHTHGGAHPPISIKCSPLVLRPSTRDLELSIWVYGAVEGFSYQFDVLVVGAGITGACLACDAARRGLSVALIDKGDFGAATSAASSKLLHGGLRYMQQLRFGKVRESAFERMYFQNLAPHLARWVPFVVPTYRALPKSKA